MPISNCFGCTGFRLGMGMDAERMVTIQYQYASDYSPLLLMSMDMSRNLAMALLEVVAMLEGNGSQVSH